MKSVAQTGSGNRTQDRDGNVQLSAQENIHTDPAGVTTYRNAMLRIGAQLCLFFEDLDDNLHLPLMASVF